MSAFVKSVSISKNILVSLTATVMAVAIAACSGGGGGGSSPSLTKVISGGAVDGPVTNANVTLYKINYDASVTNGASVTTGDVVDTGTTDSQAKIQGLSIPFPLPAAPYAFILEFTAVTNVTKDLSTCTDKTVPIDLTTCSAPVIGTMRTVITDEMISAGQNIYATPLTTMATSVALTNATGGGTYDKDGTAGISVTEFKAALQASALQVTSMLGFGLTSDVDIFTTPPLIDSTTDTTAEQQDTADYRAAITSIAAVVNEMDAQAGGDSATVFTELTNDMADGNIDGKIDTNGDGIGDTPIEVFSDTTLAVLDQDPSSLPIPNAFKADGVTPLTVADITKVLADETAATGSTTDTTALTTIVVETAPAEINPDVDNDGVLNAADAYPDDATADTDTDKDGQPDVAYTDAGRLTVDITRSDADDDNDGVVDPVDPANPAPGEDAFPLDPTETTDTDGDGTGNNTDTDDDGDGTPDTSDDFPLDATKQNKSDVDNDGWDVDADPNDNDNAIPGIAFVDTDGDGLADSGGNLPDADDDNDGVVDGSDAFPLDPTETTDTDGDGTGNNADTNDDGDLVADTQDAFPLDGTESKDTDKDGVGDNADTDADGDSHLDTDEGSTAIPDPQDTDSDGIPDYLDLDSDNDKILDENEATLADVTIVNVPNVAPVASDISTSTNEDVDASGNLSAADANVTDITNPNDVASYSLVAGSEVNIVPGTLAITAATGAFNFTPAVNFSGTASFKYFATDDAGTPANSNIATVTVTVNAVNDAPVVADDTASTSEDTASASINVRGNDSDIDGTLGAVTAGNGTNGSTVVNADNTVTYTPNADFNGTDSFTYTVVDDAGLASNAATVTVTVSPVNDAPVAADDAASTSEDTATASINVRGNDSDIDGTLAAVTAGNGTNGSTVVNADNTVTYTPNANFNGTDSFTYTVVDNLGLASNTATVTVTVSTVNDVPTATAPTLTVAEDATVAGTSQIAVVDADTADTHTYVIKTQGNNGTASVNASGLVSYTPGTLNFNGADSIVVTVSDSATPAGTVDVTITVNVTAVNDAPTATAPTLTVAEDATVAGTSQIAVVDADTADTHTYVIKTQGSNGTASVNASGLVSYTPGTLNFNGADSIVVTVSDSATPAGTVDVTITVNVTAVNDAPVAVVDTMFVQPSGSSTVNVLTNDTDVDLNTLTIVAGNPASTNGITVTNNGDGTFTYADTLSQADGATDSYSYSVTDGTVTVTGTVNVNIVANQPPVADAANLTVDEDSSGNAGTLTASDPESDAITTYALVDTSSANGTVTLTNPATGAYTYTPTTDFSGTASFTFTASDATGTSTAATISITVTGINDVPSATAPTLTVAEDATVAATSQIAVTDADTADAHTYAIKTQGGKGTASVDSNGLVSYTPNTANYNGADSIVVTVSDSATPAGTVDVTITVDITAVNDAPVATAGTLTTAQDTTATGTVAGTDVDGDSLTFTVNTNATNGVVTITDAATGAYSYVPTAGYNGSDSFTFVANDGTVDSATAIVSITVTAAPVAGVDLSGIWKMNITVTSATPIGGGSCDSVVGDAASIYITNAQSGSTVTVIAEEGQTMTGTVDTAGLGTLTGTFTATEPDLGQPTVDGATNTFSLDISFTTTSATTAGNMAGTLTLVDSFNGTQECTVVHNMTASYVYKQTGSENYNGVYAIELSENREENFGSGNQFNEGQDGLTAQFIFDAGADADGNVQLILPPGAGGTVTSSTYDPVTGFFSFALEELAEEDWDGDGVIDDYLVITDNLSGITVRDSASSGGNGAPHLKIQGRNTTRYYSDSAHTNQKGVARAESNIYGKLLVTNGYTRTALVTMSDGSTESRINVGLLNAPLQNAGGNLYLQVMDSSGIAELCNAPYLETTDGAGDGRYSMNINMPHPDIQAENFRSGTFVGNVNCNTNATNGSEQVASGDVLPVSIIDAGVDGLIDSVSGGSDDTVVFSTTVTATPVVNTNGTDRYITAITRNNINVSGAKSSATMLGGSVPLFGYFDYSEDINVSFPVHTEGADKYQIRVQEGYAKHRFTTTGTAVTILAGSLPSQNMRLVAMKDDASGARAMSFSRRIQMQEGIRGFFNIELGDGVDENILQVYLDADMNGNVSWAHVTSNVSNFFCELMVIDAITDVVTLTISDTNGLVTGTPGTNFDLKLDFKSTGTVTSGYAVVTSTAVPAIINASARAVNSEMLMRTFVSDAGVEETSITMANAFDATNTYDDATFKASSGNLIVGGVDNLVTGKKMWTTGAGNTFLDKVKRFNGMPFDDGQPQFSGQYVTKKTGSTSWNLGSGLLAAGDYKIVTKDSATGLKTLNFATTYSAPSASAYVAPSLGDMTISVPLGAGDTVCSIGTACDSTTPVDVAANNGTWAITFTGAAPTGSLWQLILTEQMAFQEYRSPLMDPTVADSGIVNNDDGTYTLTNNGILFPTGDGIVVKVQVRVMDQKGKASTIIGQTRGGQAAYMTVP